jgi:hypothetical protein
MNRLNIIRSTTWTPSVVVSSSLHPIARVSGLNANAQEISVTAVKPSIAQVSLDRPASTRRLRSDSRRSHWTRIGPTLAVEGMAASPAPLGSHPAVAAYAPDFAAPAKQPPAIAKVELTIDSLGSYELNKPIPVFVESLGNRHFVAEVPDLNISTSANNLSDILIVLKDRVTQTYDTLRLRKNLDIEQARQLKVLETYIGRSRRGWLDRR